MRKYPKKYLEILKILFVGILEKVSTNSIFLLLCSFRKGKVI